MFLDKVFAIDFIGNFVLSVGENATWDVIKKYAIREKKEKSSEYLYCEAFRDAFCMFYNERNLEFDETVVMNVFFKYVPIKKYRMGDIKKAMLEEVIYPLPVSTEDVDFFTQCLIEVLSRDEYQCILKKLQLSDYIRSVSEVDYSWMRNRMCDNWCRISVPDYEQSLGILKEIKTTMKATNWDCIKIFIGEVFFNAQKYGSAKNCILQINSDSLVLLDDGTQFNPLELRNSGDNGHGCKYALEELDEKMPNLNIEYSFHEGKYNKLMLNFDVPFFDVNELSEIIVPKITFECTIEMKVVGEYKYCFVDVYKFLETSLFSVSYSGYSSLLEKLNKEYMNGTFSKVFLYFSKIENPAVQEAYGRFVRTYNGELKGVCDYISIVPDDISKGLNVY